MLAKNSGAKNDATNSLIVARVLWRRCAESPSATPARNAPNTAWIPIQSVSAAESSASTIEKVSTPAGQLVCAWIQGSTRWIAQRPALSRASAKPAVSTTMPAASAAAPARVVPSKVAKTIQPTRSFRMAAAITVIPKSVLYR